MSKRILITGGTGFIGSALARALMTRGDDVVLLDNMRTSSLDVDLLRRGAALVCGDVRDQQKVGKAIHGVDLVLHLASLVGKRLVHDCPGEAFNVARQGTVNVLMATDAPVVIFSSSAVYGIGTPEACRESALAYDGWNHGYATGKWYAEQLAELERKNGHNVRVIRPFNVAGPGQIPDYGMVIPCLVRDVLAGRSPIVFAPGTQTRAFAHIDTFVDVVLRLLDEPEWGVSTIDVGSTCPISMNSLAQIVLDTAGVSRSIEYWDYSRIFDDVADTPHRSISETADLYLQSIVGQTAWPSTETIVRDYMEWVKSRAS